MHLNYDCLRYVLISLEKNLSIVGVDGALSFQPLSLQDLMDDPDVGCYPVEDVFYAVHNLSQAGYISASIGYDIGMDDYCFINDITYDGHMFLRSIADETIWTMVKKRFGPVITASLPLIQQIAGKLILNQIGLPS